MNNQKHQKDIADKFETMAVRVSRVSIVGNTVLSVFKLIAGLLAHSGAMVSDAIHSASDVISSFIVIIGVKTSMKESDSDHPYGHDRFESVAAIVLAMVLTMTGLFIGHSAIEKLTAENKQAVLVPGILALIAAVVSIVSKEGMYWYTRFYAKRFRSTSLMAEAWHHRSDAVSSVGSLIGIAGARMGYTWLDPAASILICLFILKAAYDIFCSAITQMVDHACEPELEKSIMDCAEAQPNVLGIQSIQTREFGNRIYVDLDIYADGSMSLSHSEQIAKQVHQAIEAQFPIIKHIKVRMKPKNMQEE